MANVINGIKINSTDYDLNLANVGNQTAINFVDDNSETYKVGVDVYGNVTANKNTSIDADINVEPKGDNVGNTSTGSYYSDYLHISAFYLGGALNKDKFAPATHNYVLLENAGKINDLSLEGVWLLYKGTNDTAWTPLALTGTIPAGTTYLIRGAQCSPKSNYTLDVDEYDIEWYKDGSLIEFDTEGASFYLVAGVYPDCTLIRDHNSGEDVLPENLSITTPYKSTELPFGYIDLVGASINGKSVLSEGAKPLIINSIFTDCTRVIFTKLNYLDPTAASNKVIGDRKTSAMWTYVNWDQYSTDEVPYYTDYNKMQLKPRCTKAGKTIQGYRTTFDESKPNYVALTFGKQATDNGSGADRCFNWISVGFYDEYVEYKRLDDTEWNKIHSIEKVGNYPYNKEYPEDSVISTYIDVYDRQRWYTIDDICVTTHKAIIRGLESDSYIYRICREGDPNYVSETYSFVVRSDSDVNTNGFTFIHHTDQQGFNIQEYKAWEKTAYVLNKYTEDNYQYYDFTINTGDMAQSGNRQAEWLDYYEGKKKFLGRVEMATLGNNDMSEIKPYINPDGKAKVYSAPIWYYYNFDLDVNNSVYFTYKHTGKLETNKIQNVISYDDSASNYTTFTYFCPSLYSFNYGNYHFIGLNSEFSNTGAKLCRTIYYTDGNEIAEGNFRQNVIYQVYRWMKKDYESALAANASTKFIAYCHEIPLSITAPIKTASTADERKTTGGSTLNIDFSEGLTYTTYDDDNKSNYVGGCCFSEFFDKHNIRVCFGGHKHTYSLSRPVNENVTTVDGVRTVDPNNPITYSITIDGSTQIANSTGTVYAMSQATGYKLVSNKELPGSGLMDKWLWKYFPCTWVDTENKANNSQFYPMFHVMSCDSNGVTIEPYYVDNIYTHDSTGAYTAFNINSNNTGNIGECKHITVEGSTDPIKLIVNY